MSNPGSHLQRIEFALLVTLVIGGATGGCGGGNPGVPIATVTGYLAEHSVQLGSPVTLSLQFVAAPNLVPLKEDYLVMVHFLDASGDMMWTADHEPPTPTSQWQPGETISYTRRLLIPMYPYIGEAVVIVGLYSVISGERLALAGDHIGQREYRVATISLEPQPEGSFVSYQDGWHGDEFIPETGESSRWSTGRASLLFRNPGSDAVLYLEFSGRPEVFEPDQEVTLRLGEEMVYRTTIDSPGRNLYEVPLKLDQLGDEETVTLDLAVDQTFVPALITADSSDDPRNLGVRVFYAFLKPQ